MNNELYHFGIKGQRWGVRRFQNEDGTYTSEGKERYGRDDSVGSAKRAMEEARLERRKVNKEYNKAFKEWYDHPLRQFSFRKSTREKDAKAWHEVLRTADNANKSSDKYKQAKQAYKDAKKAYKNTPEAKAEKAERRKVLTVFAKTGATSLAVGALMGAIGSVTVNSIKKARDDKYAAGARRLAEQYVKELGQYPAIFSNISIKER